MEKKWEYKTIEEGADLNVLGVPFYRGFVVGDGTYLWVLVLQSIDSESKMNTRCSFQQRRPDDVKLLLSLLQANGHRIEIKKHHIEEGKNFIFFSHFFSCWAFLVREEFAVRKLAF